MKTSTSENLDNISNHELILKEGTNLRQVNC
jgi:hypothetical protein